MIEIVGWAGSFSLALCGLPLAVKCYRDGHAKGLSAAFLWMWWGGEVGLLAYAVDGALGLPVVTNYGANLALVSVMLRYFHFPRSDRGE